TPIQNCRPRRIPNESRGLFGPESLGIILRALPHSLVGAKARDVRVLGEFGGWRKDPVLNQEAVNRSAAGVRRHGRKLRARLMGSSRDIDQVRPGSLWRGRPILRVVVRLSQSWHGRLLAYAKPEVRLERV